MKKLFFIVFFTIYSSLICFAQRNRAMQGDGPGMERIHAAKMAYITDRLHLSTSQMTNFLPLYNDYESEIKSVRQTFKQKYQKEYPDANGATIMMYVMDDLDFQTQVLPIKRKYQDRFLKIMSQQQYTDLSVAEHEFKQMLARRLKNHQEGGRGGWRR